MKSKYLIAAVFLTLITTGGLWLSGNFSDKREEMRHALHQTLEELGFIGPILPDQNRNNEPYSFRKIVLDPDEFGRIASIKITPPGLLDMGKRRFKRLEIEGLGLTGGINKDGVFTLSGVIEGDRLETRDGLLDILNLADTLILKKAQLDILSDQLGGINLKTDLELRRGPDDTQVIGTFRSAQKQFTLEGKVSGTISPETGEWELALTIEEGKADIAPLLLSRLYGEISMTGNGWALTSLYGQNTAGSMVFYGYPFQAPSFTFEYRDHELKVLAETKDHPEKQQDEQGLEFGFLYTGSKPGKVQVSVFSPDIPRLMTFLKLTDGANTAPVQSYKNINLILEAPLLSAPEEETRLPFIIKSQDDTPEKSGFAIVKKDKDKNKAELSNIFWTD